MKQITLSATGFAPDVTWDGTHLIVAHQPAAVSPSAPSELRIARIDPSDLHVVSTDAIPLAPGTMAFPRVCWYAGCLWLAHLQHVGDDHGDDLAYLRGGQEPELLGASIGNWPLAFGSGYLAWQERATLQVNVRPLLGGGWRQTGRYGSMGISRILPDGSVRTGEDDLRAEPGMYSPCWTEGMIAGESTEDNRGSILRLLDGRECRLWQDHRVLMIRAVAIPGGWAVVGEPGILAVVTEADFSAPIPEPEPPHEEPEDTMKPPGVDIMTGYPVTLSRTGTVTLAAWKDRHNPGHGGRVEIVNGSVHVTLTNPAGSDRSGLRRPVNWK